MPNFFSRLKADPPPLFPTPMPPIDRRDRLAILADAASLYPATPDGKIEFAKHLADVTRDHFGLSAGRQVCDFAATVKVRNA